MKNKKIIFSFILSLIMVIGMVGTTLAEQKIQETTIDGDVSSSCSHLKKEKAIEDKYLKTAGTCTTSAVYYYKCTLCGEKITNETYTNGTPSHTFSYRDYNASYHWSVCSVCGNTYNKYSHNSSKWVKIDGDNEEHQKYCNVCGLYMGTGSHSFSYEYTNLSKHKRTCACGYSDTVAHNGGNWYYAKNGTTDAKYHYKDCLDCKKQIGKEEHNNDTKLEIKGDTEEHDTFCSVCSLGMGKEAHEMHYPEEKMARDGEIETHVYECKTCEFENEPEEHIWSKGNPDEHVCSICEWTRKYDDGKDYHYYNVKNGGVIGEDVSMVAGGFKCRMKNCDFSNQMSDETPIGLPINDYGALDGKNNMSNLPKIVDGTYLLEFSGKLRDMDGNPITSLGIKDEWLTLYQWEHLTVGGHIRASESNKEQNKKELYEYADSIDTGSPHDDTPDQVRAFADKVYSSENINASAYDMSQNCYKNWPQVFKKDIKEAISRGEAKMPDVTLKNSQTFELKFEGFEGSNWFIENTLFYGANIGGGFGVLFGTVGTEPEDLYATIHYAYRTTDNKIPTNFTVDGEEIKEYENFYTNKPVCIYHNGQARESVGFTIPADLEKIDRTGYRYLGYKISYGWPGEAYVSKYDGNLNEEDVAKGTVGFAKKKTAAFVTFFVEPVTFSYGQKAVDYEGNIIKLKSSDERQENEELEFRNYYVGEEGKGRCIISVESLYKPDKPGFILDSAKTYEKGLPDFDKKYGKEGKAIYEKTYDSDTTTQLEVGKTFIATDVPSAYRNDDGYKKDYDYYYDSKGRDYSAGGGNENVSGANEASGHAADKEFYYFYKTPVIEIEHVDYESDDYMKTTSGSDIKYTVQIRNATANIESLVTDGVKLPKTLRILNAAGEYESFVYECPTYDLVQIEVYEIVNGKEKILGVLYEDDTYKPSKKTQFISDYRGVFKDFYSETVDELADRLNIEMVTSRNWKIRFKYDAIERVHIRFMDLNGSTIRVTYQGDDVDEISEKLPFSYTSHDIIYGRRNFRLIGYTMDKNSYIFDSGKMEDISAGTTLDFPKNDGDRYVVFFYSTENVLTVEYRDKDENQIMPSDVIELPKDGVEIEIPYISSLTSFEYAHDKDYDGVLEQIGTKADGTPIYGIAGERTSITKEQKTIFVDNSSEKNQYIIIYYDKTNTLKVEYRDIAGDTPLKVPPKHESEEMLNIPEEGICVPVPSVPGYKAMYYIKNENSMGAPTSSSEKTTTTENDQISFESDGKDKYLVIYYQKVSETAGLIIEYRKDSVTGDLFEDPTSVNIVVGESNPIYPKTFDAYKVRSYALNGENEQYIQGDAYVEVVGDSTLGTQKLIFVYNIIVDPNDKVITMDDNIEEIYVYANNKGMEEFDVEKAIPTSENLYFSGDIYGYRFINELKEKTITKEIDVEVVQRYYKDMNDTSDIGTITVNTRVPIIYNYYEIVRADLYDLKSINLKNDAIKYYNNYDYNTNSYGGYVEGEANYPVSKETPEIIYEAPKDIVSIAETESNLDLDAKIQITSSGAYTIYKTGEESCKVVINDIDYYPAVELENVKGQMELEAPAIIESCTKIKVQELAIKMSEETIVILTGERYNLPKKSEALKDKLYYIPYTVGRTPLYSFYHPNDLYVQEQATNGNHSSSVRGDYRLYQNIDATTDTVLTHDPKTKPSLDIDHSRINYINVYTPIINKTTLELDEENKKATQLINVPSGITVLNLEEKFTVTSLNNNGPFDGLNGYATLDYNTYGLGIETDDRLIEKSKYKDKLNTENIFNNSGENTSIIEANMKSEKNAIGPSFAEFKLIKFPYDVYLINNEKTTTPVLLCANKWYNLYEYVKPTNTKYEFSIPTWVEDAKEYKGANGIHLLIVAENCPVNDLKNALINPLSVADTQNNFDSKKYILRKSFDTYVSGRVYDLQIRDTDDPGYKNKLVSTLKGDISSPTSIKEMPIAQKGQVTANNLGLKMGYRFYFDLKTKGMANDTITVKPKFYYVSPTGTVNENVSLFYHSTGSMYNELSAQDLNVRMSMASTHGNVNNIAYTNETIDAKQLVPARVFTNTVTIGKVAAGLVLNKATEKLPYDNIKELAIAMGFEESEIEAFKESALTSVYYETEDAEKRIDRIKDNTGHWYGEYYLPASTIVVPEAGVDRKDVMNGTKKPATTGYLVVVFKEIITNNGENEYLSYDKPSSDTQYEKEGIEKTIVLPAGAYGTTVTLPGNVTAPMAIYQVGLRANNDFEQVGTH